MNPIRLLPAALLLGACSTYVAPPEAFESAGARSVQDGTAEAYGILAMLNDPIVTEGILDGSVALDSRAARGLIHHRNGPDEVFGTGDDDLFDTMDEVDDVYYVGSAAIDRLATFAADNGWVPKGTDWIGAWDDVDFTLDDAIFTVELANIATFEELDVAVGLSSRAADNIVAMRPFVTVAELADVPYVGKSALTALRDTATVQ